MSAIPSKLIMLRTLVNVPVSEYADICPPKNALNVHERLSFFKRLRQKPSTAQTKDVKSKQISFNAAVWLSFNKVMNRPVSLWLSYKDASGENTILVDEQCITESKSAMLSGTISLNVKGHIEYLRACCGGVSMEEHFCVDEVCVKRQDFVFEVADPFAVMMAS